MTGAEDSASLALIIGGLGAAVSGISGLAVLLLLARIGRSEKKADDLETSLNGKDGTWTKLSGVESWARGIEARVKGLEDGRLSVQIFESETKAQNERLEDIKRQNTKLEIEIKDLAVRIPPRPYGR